MANKAILIIMDGWGIAENVADSAIDAAYTPFYEMALRTYPHSRLKASEEAVGLPVGQMGNSEVGHINLGAGRVVFQELERINRAIRTNDKGEAEVEQNPAFKSLMAYCKAGHPLHLMGLVSSGGVHSHIDHLEGLLVLLKKYQLPKVYIHCFTDGRDTGPESGAGFMDDLSATIAATGVGRIVSVIGRYFAMDRDKRWARVQKAYDLLLQGKGEAFATAQEALKASYAKGITDEFVEPASIHAAGEQPVTIHEKDAVLFFNFRTDRGRQLTEVLTQHDQPDFGMKTLPLKFVTLARYDHAFHDVDVIFEKDDLKQTLGEVLADAGKTQIRIAETEKYPHVTFFFNGGREEPFAGESRILCPSPKVATYDLQPEMSAYAIRDAIMPKLLASEPDFVCLNFANADMVGHTGVFEAAKKACETVDECVRDVVEAAKTGGYHSIIIADHGNADKMFNADGSVHTSHTLALVPCILVPADDKHYTLTDGKLGDIAPTILTLMHQPIPAVMTGEVLVSVS